MQQKLGKQIAEIRSSLEAAEEENIDQEIIVHKVAQSSWQTGVYQRQPEEARPSEEEEMSP